MQGRVIVLGSTGSIGQASLEVLRSLPSCRVVGLAANSSWSMLAEQAATHHPAAVAICDDQYAGQLGSRIDGVRVYSGAGAMQTLIETVDCDCVLAAVVGAAGLPPVLSAVRAGKRVAIANKEPLVMAGDMIMSLAGESGAQIIPVDSEHSAVFQALHAGRRSEVRKVILTASGGPFRNLEPSRLAGVTVSDALAHPTWNMGPKVTIDSATMMNKTLEIIEAHHLFGLESEQIEVLIHPESIVHAIVEFVDGSMIAQMGAPDMRTPIQYALTYPTRSECPSRSLNLSKIGRLTFEPPDPQRYPALRLAYQVIAAGGVAGAVLNAANESAVELFRQGEIRFTEIVELAEQALLRHKPIESPTLDQLLAADRWARDEVTRCLTC